LVGVTRGLSYLHEIEVIHGDLKSVIRISSSFSFNSSRLTYHLSQPNILIDAKGCPYLSDFGLCSITRNIESVNASTPHPGYTIRYCAPELLDVGKAIKDVKRKATNKSDVYSLSMVIVEVNTFYNAWYAQVQILFAYSSRPGRCRFLNVRMRESPS